MVHTAMRLGTSTRLSKVKATTPAFWVISVMNTSAAAARSSATSSRAITALGGSPYRSVSSSTRSEASSVVRMAAIRRYRSIRCRGEDTYFSGMWAEVARSAEQSGRMSRPLPCCSSTASFSSFRYIS